MLAVGKSIPALTVYEKSRTKFSLMIWESLGVSAIDQIDNAECFAGYRLLNLKRGLVV